ncbi:MAG: phage tail protein [Oligoflexia bacterium]|nr:phage tail protein [Oligoflexia bacterium]
MTTFYKFEHNIPYIDKYLHGLATNVAVKALHRSIDRSASMGRTIIVQSVYKKLNIKQQEIRGRVQIKKSLSTQYIEQIEAEILIKSKNISLSKFVTGKFLERKIKRPSRYHKSASKGLTVEIFRKRKNEIIGSFAGKQRQTGGILLFKRREKKRLPLNELYGPGVASVFSMQEVMVDFDTKTREYLIKNFYRDFAYYLKKI